MEFLELLTLPEDQRNAEWEAEFLSLFPSAKLKLMDPQPRVGADGFPYLFAQTGGDSLEPATRLLQWLSTRGVGLAVNPHKEIPDYIFSFGMIWHFKETGRFFNLPPP